MSPVSKLLYMACTCSSSCPEPLVLEELRSRCPLRGVHLDAPADERARRVDVILAHVFCDVREAPQAVFKHAGARRADDYQLDCTRTHGR